MPALPVRNPGSPRTPELGPSDVSGGLVQLNVHVPASINIGDAGVVATHSGCFDAGHREPDSNP